MIWLALAVLIGANIIASSIEDAARRADSAMYRISEALKERP